MLLKRNFRRILSLRKPMKVYPRLSDILRRIWVSCQSVLEGEPQVTAGSFFRYCSLSCSTYDRFCIVFPFTKVGGGQASKCTFSNGDQQGRTIKTKKDEAASEEKVVKTSQENKRKSIGAKSAIAGQIAEDNQIEIAKDTIKKEVIAVSEKITSDNLSNISTALPISKSLPSYNASGEISEKSYFGGR